jgi:hypothetical protein
MIIYFIPKLLNSPESVASSALQANQVLRFNWLNAFNQNSTIERKRSIKNQ